MDKAHRTAFNNMLEQAKTHSLATFEAKYQKGLERIRKTETITYRKSISSTTDEYRKRMDASLDKHRIAMNQKSNDMETLANDLVENAPFEADKEISYVVNDAIREVTESTTNIKEQSIAGWTSSTIPAKSLSPQIKQAVDYAITQRQHEVTRLDEHILQPQTTITELETTIAQQQQGLTIFLQNSQHTFETMIHDIIKHEIGNNKGSRLNDLLTRETTSTVEQMVKIQPLKTTINTHFIVKEKELTKRMNAFESIQQNKRHDDRNHTRHDTHDRPDRPEYGAHNLHSNLGAYSTPVQSEHHETNNTPLEEEERKLPWNHTTCTMRTSIQVMLNIHRFKREVIEHNLTADPRQDQLENFFNTLVTSLESYEMPIRRLTHLQPWGTTLPSEPTISASTLDTVTWVLFGKLLEAIPEE
jgi:vacuolar-type H+-ATPase subunit H